MVDTSWLGNGGAAAIVGALVGSIVGGSITGAVQWVVLKHTAFERDQALARALLSKLGRMYSHLQKAHEHLEAAFAMVDPNRHASPSTFVESFPNTQQRLNFTEDELGVVLRLGGAELFNDLIMRDELHNAALDILDFYHERRLGFLDSLAPVRVQGQIVDIPINETTKRRIIELDGLVAQVREHIGPDAGRLMNLLQQAAEAFNRKLKLNYTVMPRR
ncbi:hypothetical protein [Phenylobacterium montanum]|uniref:Uncharacterized protein n=1 Tax=Phenylobacterium montanum TaxID=2823693 RepID=A0A975IVG1_9CAUL|nr:hypothetical protein [Caulobacter sp. S6]QUD88967.1 hypothetical protein KCG34_03515 [Caulobacter sp. S6]